MLKFTARPTTLEAPFYPLIAADLSLNSTGVSVWGRDGVQSLLFAPKNLFGIARIEWHLTQWAELLELFPSCPVFFEGYSFNSEASRAHALGELGGVVKMLVRGQRRQQADIPPNNVKQVVTGKGNSPKATVLKELYKRWMFDINQDDEGDAVAVGVAAQYALARRFAIARPLPADNARGLEKIDLSGLSAPARSRVRPENLKLVAKSA